MYIAVIHVHILFNIDQMVCICFIPMIHVVIHQLFIVYIINIVTRFLPELYLVTRIPLSINDKQNKTIFCLNITSLMRYLKINKQYNSNTIKQNNYLPEEYVYCPAVCIWPQQRTFISEKQWAKSNPPIDRYCITHAFLHCIELNEPFTLSRKTSNTINGIKFSTFKSNRVHLVDKAYTCEFFSIQTHIFNSELLNYHALIPTLANYPNRITPCFKVHITYTRFNTGTIGLRSHQLKGTCYYYLGCKNMCNNYILSKIINMYFKCVAIKCYKIVISCSAFKSKNIYNVFTIINYDIYKYN